MFVYLEKNSNETGEFCIMHIGLATNQLNPAMQNDRYNCCSFSLYPLHCPVSSRRTSRTSFFRNNTEIVLDAQNVLNYFHPCVSYIFLTYYTM